MDLYHHRRGWRDTSRLADQASEEGGGSQGQALASRYDAKCFFLNGDPSERDNFINIAKDWIPDGVNLKLGRTTDISKSQIRVDLNSPSNESYIGTDSLTRVNQWTLPVAKVTLDRVLHEFGHALGLNHEHSHSSANIPWNKEQVYKDLGAPPNLWSRAKVDEFVFEKFDKEKDEILTDFDIRSVMMYPIWPNWTTDGESFSQRAELSGGDNATIRALYA